MLEKMTRLALSAALDETGHTLGLDDLDAITELNGYAVQVVRGESDEHALIETPIAIGGVIFEPLTLSKIIWMHDIGSAWFDDEDQSMVVPYALYVDADALWQYTSAKELLRDVKLWVRKTKLTPEHIARLIEWAFPQKDGGDNKDGDSYGPIIALLCREYGSTPDYWLNASFGLVRAMLDDYTQRMNAEREAASRGGKAVAPVATPKMIALRNFTKKKNAIIESWANDGK